MEINTEIDDLIKTFIKVEYPENKKDNIYEIDNSKKLLTLYNFESSTHSQSSFLFEFDKIFTNKDANSYIYEEICLNCIKDCLKGISFNFISYGETISNKFDLLYGDLKNDYTNINNHGLFIRFLNNLINNSNCNNCNYNIKLSYLLVYDDNLIDLSIYENKKSYNLTVEEFLNKSFKIKYDSNIIDKINKKPINKINKILLFLKKIINILLKFEDKRKNNIYSLSHICIIIYLMDKNEKILSTISFLQLNGNEHLYDIDNKNKNKKIINNSTNKKEHFETIKHSLGVELTYDNISNLIQNNKYINNLINKHFNKKKLEKNQISEIMGIKQIDDEDNKKMSKLGVVLNNICLGKNISNVKFRIIGNIRPITGYFKTTRDTLLFVSNCKNMFKNAKKNEKNLMHEEQDKEDILDLNYKINLQIKQIENLTQAIRKKDEKIDLLTNTYNKQINTLKKCFDFKGDINVLMSGDINSEEAMYARNLKDSNITIRRLKGEINILNEKLENLNKDLFKYKNIAKIRENDKIMLDYFLNAQDLKDKKYAKNENNNDLVSLNKEIDYLKEVITTKDKIIEELKKDLNIKNNILSNLPKSISITNIKNNKNGNIKNIDENQSELNETYVMLKNEIKKLKLNEQKLNDSLKMKYETIILEKKNKIYKLEQKLEGIEENYKSEINMLNKELVRLYEIFLYITTNYQNIFCSDNYFKDNNINNKEKKEEFDKVVINIDKDINYFNFYGLHKELENQNKTKQTIIQSLHIDQVYKNLKNESNISENTKKLEELENMEEKENSMIIEKNNIISKLNKKILNMANYIGQQAKINNHNYLIINSQKRTIDNLQKETFIYNNLLKRKIKNKLINKNSHHNSHLAIYKNQNNSNNSNFKNIYSSLDISQKTNRIIRDYNNFNSSQKNNESMNYLLNLSKINNKNESINNGSINQPSTRSNNIDLKISSTNTIISSNTKNTSNTNRIKSPKKVFFLKNIKGQIAHI